MMIRRHAFTALACILAAAPIARAADDQLPTTIIDNGLEYLKRTQDRDGKWGDGAHTAACTGLSVMAFMARGHTPGQGPFGDTINRGIDYILSCQRADGVLAKAGLDQPMYDHGICSVALCEAYGMLDEARQARVRDAITKAIRVILRAQKLETKQGDDHGGWRYTTEANDSDTSVTGWQLMALRGARNAGAAIPETAINAGIDYIKRRADPRGSGAFSYQRNSGQTIALTGTGVLALSLMGEAQSPEVQAGGVFLMTNVPSIIDPSRFYYYGVYYCSQAAWQVGGQVWAQVSKAIIDSLRSRQLPDGSWSTSGSGMSEGGPSGCTALAILALTVPYKYLPIYQGGKDGQ